jgi:hypothetical protein
MIGLNLVFSKWRTLLLGSVLATSVGTVCAALGQAPSALSAPSSAALPSVRKLAATPAAQTGLYSTQETQLESGTSVVEYVSPAGLVFAVSWRGPVLPDLSSLLGDFFKTFKLETEQARLKGRRGSPVNIESDGLVIRSNGRMRNFFGYAYAPALIPAGVNINDVLK